MQPEPFFYERFLLVINIRNLRIKLCYEFLYLYIFYNVYDGVHPLVNTPLFTLKLEFCPNSLRMTPESQRP